MAPSKLGSHLVARLGAGKPRLAIASAALALAACGGGSDESSAAPASIPVAPVAFPASIDYAAPAQPLDVVPALDPANKVTANLPATGGTLSVTGADGTRYTLLVPDRALSSAVTISMQVIHSLGATAEGVESVQGVQLEPSGLVLNDFATLTIESAPDIPVSRQAFFAYSGGGKDLHLVPPVRSAALQLRVWHFSGYGLAQLARERDVTSAFVQIVPADARARLDQAIARVLGAERAQQLLGVGPGDLDPGDDTRTVQAYLDDYEARVIRLQLLSANLSCANAVAARADVLSFQRLRSLLGLEGSAIDVGDLADDVRTQCFQEAEQRCRVSGDYPGLIATQLALERDSLLMGNGEADAQTDAREREAIDRCARFELTFENSQRSDLQAPLGFERLAVKTVVPLRLSEPTVAGRLEGSARLDYTETTSGPNCAIDGCSYYEVLSTVPSTAQVRAGEVAFRPSYVPYMFALASPAQLANLAPPVGSFAVEFNDGTPKEVVSVVVKAGGGVVLGPSQTVPFWSNFFALQHATAEGSGDPGWYRWKDDWTSDHITYPVMFERALDVTGTDNFVGSAILLADTTRVRLVHRPAP